MHETPQDVNPASPAQDRIAVTTPKQFTLAIVESVAARHGVTVAQIMSHCRQAPIVAARHEAMAEVVESRPHWSYPTVGKLFGRDHTTVMSALQKLGRYERRGYRFRNHANGVELANSLGQFCASLQIDWKGGAE